MQKFHFCVCLIMNDNQDQKGQSKEREGDYV